MSVRNNFAITRVEHIEGGKPRGGGGGKQTQRKAFREIPDRNIFCNVALENVVLVAPVQASIFRSTLPARRGY